MDGQIWKIAAALFPLVMLDRVLLAMESRGWIYWRRTKLRRSGGLGSGLQELQCFFQPGQQHVIDIQRDEHEDTDKAGDDRGRLKR